MKRIKFYIYFALISCTALIICACMYISTKENVVDKHSTTPSKPVVKKSQISIISKSSMSNFASKKELEALREKIKENKEFRVRIFGDSHMAADFFSRELRKVLLDVNAVGFVYPLQPKYQQALILDYESKDFELFNSQNDSSQDYSLGGIVAKAKKEEAFIKLSPHLKDDVFNFSISFKPASKGVAFVVKDSKDKEIKLDCNERNWQLRRLNDLTFPITVIAKQKDALLGGYFISKDKDNKIIDTLGINGARSNLWKKWNEDFTKIQLDSMKSDLIILAYGSNDTLIGNFNKSKFKNEYKQFIQILRKINPQASIFLIAPPTVTQKENGIYKLSGDFYAVQKALYELAKEEHLVLFDMHSFIEASGGKDKWIEQGLSKEDVHLKVEGYQLMAQQFYRDLSELLKLRKE